MDNIERIKMEISEGNRNSYSELFKWAYPKLITFAKSYTIAEEQCEEIASDVLIYIWFNRDKIVDIKYFKAYLYKSARNAVLNYKNRNKVKIISGDDYESISPIVLNFTPETAYLNSELRLLLTKAIATLPPKCKECFMLVKEEGLSYKEAAEVLGVSTKTVDAQMVIAVKKLSQILYPVLNG